MKHLGVLTGFLFFVIASISIAVNPWFKFLRHSFSHLGRSSATDPWIYNSGMVLLGVLLFIFTLYLLYRSSYKLQIASCGVLIVASIFLALIGIFHMGKDPHAFVSLTFFLLIELAMLMFGIGTVIVDQRYGKALLVLTAFAWLLEFVPMWSSVALLEAVAILTMTIRASLLSRIVDD